MSYSAPIKYKRFVHVYNGYYSFATRLFLYHVDTNGADKVIASE